LKKQNDKYDAYFSLYDYQEFLINRITKRHGYDIRNINSHDVEKVTDVIKIIEKHIKNNKKYKWIFLFFLATAYFEINYYDEALEYAEACLEKNPYDYRSSFAIATLYRTIAKSKEDFEYLKNLQGGDEFYSFYKNEFYNFDRIKHLRKKLSLSRKECLEKSLSFFENCKSRLVDNSRKNPWLILLFIMCNTNWQCFL